jgi:glycopeptide antibiotics resistance protein
MTPWMPISIGNIPYGDKIAHIVLFFILMVILSRKFKFYIIKTGMVLFSIGIFMEGMQYIISYRSAEIMDVISNGIGITIGYIYLKLRGQVNE